MNKYNTNLFGYNFNISIKIKSKFEMHPIFISTYIIRHRDLFILFQSIRVFRGRVTIFSDFELKIITSNLSNKENSFSSMPLEFSLFSINELQSVITQIGSHIFSFNFDFIGPIFILFISFNLQIFFYNRSLSILQTNI